jgi:hypothetical protein
MWRAHHIRRSIRTATQREQEQDKVRVAKNIGTRLLCTLRSAKNKLLNLSTLQSICLKRGFNRTVAGPDFCIDHSRSLRIGSRTLKAQWALKMRK